MCEAVRRRTLRVLVSTIEGEDCNAIHTSAPRPDTDRLSRGCQRILVRGNDVINNIDDNLAAGQTDLGIAATDFSHSDVSGGLAALVDGLNDDFVSPPEQLYIGTVEVLTNAPVYNEGEFVLGPEADFAAGVTAAENSFTFGEGEFTAAEGYFTSGDSLAPPNSTSPV